MSAWSEFLEDAFADPAQRILDLVVEEREVGGRPIGVTTLRFTAEDLRGEEYVASAHLYLPDALLEDGVDRLPAWFNCGYQLDVAHVPRHLERGHLVVTPCDPVDGQVFPHPSPLCRGPNTDIVLTHLVRGARFIEPARIVYGGGSAGGYAALLVAAATFPTPVVVANVPVVNLAYQGAYCMANCPRIAADPPADYPLMGLLMGEFAKFAEEGWSRSFGTDLSAPAWLGHSPVAHLERITGPVAACFSTADFLVPIEQVGSNVARATLADLPPGVVMAADDLTDAKQASLRLIDELADAAEVRVVPVPDGAVEMRMDQLDLTMSTPQVPVPIPAATDNGQQWLVTVVDEGPTVMGIGHTRHGFEPDFEAFIEHATASGIAANQLTSPKLDQLIDRWSGREWLAEGFHHLDRPAAERADVERGLRLYASCSPEHSRTFARCYEALPAERQVLPDRLVADLADASSVSPR